MPKLCKLIPDKPLVSIDPIFARPNQLVTFVCKVIGYPSPAIRFAFIPCIGEPWRNCSQALSKESATTYVSIKKNPAALLELGVWLLSS